jgi:hypothetical protein
MPSVSSDVSQEWSLDQRINGKPEQAARGNTEGD